MTKDENEKVIQVLANLAEVIELVGVKELRRLRVLRSWNKAYQVLYKLIRREA